MVKERECGGEEGEGVWMVSVDGEEGEGVWMVRRERECGW